MVNINIAAFRRHGITQFGRNVPKVQETLLSLSSRYHFVYCEDEGISSSQYPDHFKRKRTMQHEHLTTTIHH
jgi:hypothetical protein